MKKSSRKGKVAKFSQETKLAILLRDKCCIICNRWNKVSVITDFHHVYYWLQAEYTEDRNDVNKWVWLCAQCHFNIHHWTKVDTQELRYFCINYLLEYYDKNKEWQIEEEE